MAGFSSGVPLPDIQYLRQHAREELVESLKSVRGKKDLVLDVDLMKPLDRFAGISLLKEHGVEKIYKLEGPKAVQGTNPVMYLVRPQVHLMKYIAQQINEDLKNGIKKPYTIVFVPRKLHVCELVLEQEGIYGHVTLDTLALDFIPLDKDILSLELPNFFTDFYLDGDQSWCHTAARGLVTLQQIFGLIPNVYGLGSCAKIVQDLTEVIFEDVGEPKQLNSEIGHVFLMDRAVDMVGPMCSQLVYGGLLDDYFTVKSGYVEFGKEVTGTDQGVKLLLSSEDEVFDDIRDRHFSNVFGYLSAKAKELQSGYDKRHDLSLKDMKAYVAQELKGLKQQHKSLSVHIGACEVILKNKNKEFEDMLQTEHYLLEGCETKECINYIEETIHRQLSRKDILRLLCLLSLTQNGVPSQTYKALKTQFLHSHGFEHLMTFHQLRRLGLFVEQDGSQAARLSLVAASMYLPRSSQFRTLCKKLSLIPKSPEDINLKIPNDMSFVYSGAYVPLTCRLVEQVLGRQGFTGLEDVMKLLAGPNICKVKPKSARGGGGAGSKASQVVLVFFLGGCTYSEIAALRYLGHQKGYRFIFATTSIINSSSIINAVSSVA